MFWQFDEETNLLDQLQFENNADLYPVLRFLQEEFSCTFFMKTKYWIFRKPYCSKKEMCYLQKGEKLHINIKFFNVLFFIYIFSLS